MSRLSIPLRGDRIALLHVMGPTDKGCLSEPVSSSGENEPTRDQSHWSYILRRPGRLRCDFCEGRTTRPRKSPPHDLSPSSARRAVGFLAIPPNELRRTRSRRGDRRRACRNRRRPRLSPLRYSWPGPLLEIWCPSSVAIPKLVVT